MDLDRKHRLEVVALKRELKRAKRHIKEIESIAHQRRRAYIDLRDDVFHFCEQWLECLDLLGDDWRSRASTKKAWFEYCLEVFPQSETDLMSKMHQSRLFEHGEIPPIQKPPK